MIPRWREPCHEKPPCSNDAGWPTCCHSVFPRCSSPRTPLSGPIAHRARGAQSDGLSRASNAGVHHRQMDRSLREIGGRGGEGKGSFHEGTRHCLGSDLGESGSRSDSCNESLHGPKKPIARSEISGQGDQAHGAIQADRERVASRWRRALEGRRAAG